MSTPGNDRAPEADRLYATARQLLATYGVRIEDATRPVHSQSNEVWLCERLVLRLSRAADGSLSREAALTAILPAAVGYPRVLGHGVGEGHEWIVTARLPGANLEESWPALDNAARGRAVEDLWERLRALHRTNVDQARALGCTPTPFYALDETAARRQVDELADRDVIDRTVHGQLCGMLDAMFRALTGVPVVLTHTDAGPHNTVWDGERAVPIDFEFACVAPADLDLEHLLRTVFAQPEGPRAAQRVVNQAADLLRPPGARDRLWGYAVLADLWGLHHWLRHAAKTGDPAIWGADADDIRTWAPWLHLHAHANRTSWLAELL
jgi:aminoglycoside phosphotransferase